MSHPRHNLEETTTPRPLRDEENIFTQQRTRTLRRPLAWVTSLGLHAIDFPKMTERKKLCTGAPGRQRAHIRQTKKREDLPNLSKGGDQETTGSVEQAHSSDPGQLRPSAIRAYLTADTLQKPKLLICLFGRLRQSQDELITAISAVAKWV